MIFICFNVESLLFIFIMKGFNMRSVLMGYGQQYLILLALCLLILSSGCTQVKSDNNPFTGVYQLENNPEVNFIITERAGKLYEINTGEIGELSVNDDNSYAIKEWQVTGNFLNEINGEFQQVVLQRQGQQYTYKRIQQQPTTQFLYKSDSNVTDISHPNQQECEDPYPLYSLSENSQHPEKIKKLLKQIKSGRYSWDQHDSLLIFKDGKLLVEEYFNGWTQDEPHQLQSVSKSLTSLLVGKLITEGKLQDVNTPIIELIPQYKDLLTGEKSKITLAHLMNMAAGIEWNEWDVSYEDPNNLMNKLLASDDAVAFTLARPLTNKIGNHFSYSRGYVSVVTAALDAIVDQDKVEDYARETLSKSLCFKNAFWQYTENKTSGSGYLRPIDMLKIGQLMLDDGKWLGEQVISEQWIKDSMDPQINTNYDKYGYFWWRDVSFSAGESYTVVQASGYGGQEIIIVKELGLIVVATASNYDAFGKANVMLKRFIIPAFIE